MDRRQVLSKAMIGLGGVALASSATSASNLNASGQCLNIKDFGAIGDGIENDTLAFKNALAELKIQGGGTLYIPATEKEFCISENIEITTNNVHIIFDGWVRWCGGDAVGGAFDAMFVPQAGASNITLSNIKLDCGLSKGLCGVAFRRNNRHCIVNGGIIINARHNSNNNSEGARIGGGSALLLEDGVTGSDPKQNIISNLIVENCYQAIRYSGAGGPKDLDNALTIINNLTCNNCNTVLALYGNAEGYPHDGETSSLIVNNITARNVGAKGIANPDSNGIIFCQRSCNIIINNFYIFNTQKYFDDNTVEYFFNGAHYNIHVSNVIIDSDIETLISSGVEDVTSEKNTFDVTCNGTILYRTLQRPSGRFINCKFNLKTNKVGSNRFIDASMDDQENNFIEFSNNEFNTKLSTKIGTLSGEGISSNFLISNFKDQYNPIFTSLSFVDKNGNLRDLTSLTNGQLLFDENIIA